MRVHLAAVVFAILPIALDAGAAGAKLARALDPYFDALERDGRMHGSVAIVREGKLVYGRAIGMRAGAAGSPLAANAQTAYRAGSITKLYTAVMTYQLIDEGTLSLDTRLSEFFPAIANAERITIAHLLSHSSGIGNYPPPDAANDPTAWPFHPQSKSAMLARFASLQPDHAPGERSTYSNTNFALLGYIVEAVTKSTYAAQLERRITRKLRAKRTRFGGAIDAAKNDAQSFAYDEGKWHVRPEQHASVAAGAGAIVSTATELATFMSALFNRRLMSGGAVAEMLVPFSPSLPGSEKGVVVFRLNDRSRTAYQHLGGIDAFQSSLTFLPDQNAAIAIVFNGQNYPMGKVFYAIVDGLAGRDVAVPSFTPVELPPQTLARYEGVYAFPEIGMTITVRQSGKHLSAQASGQEPFALDPIAEAMFSHPPSGILIEFREGALVLFQGPSQLRFKRSE